MLLDLNYQINYTGTMSILPDYRLLNVLIASAICSIRFVNRDLSYLENCL